jgi:hypothetical protein
MSADCRRAELRLILRSRAKPGVSKVLILRSRAKPGVSKVLILRSRAKPGVSKDPSEGRAGAALTGSSRRRARGRLFEAASRRLRTRGCLKGRGR